VAVSGDAFRWNPILDVFDECRVRFAHEVHPSEIAYDFVSAGRSDVPWESSFRDLARGSTCAPPRWSRRHLQGPYNENLRGRVQAPQCKRSRIDTASR
jgi:hypothetical protein